MTDALGVVLDVLAAVCLLGGSFLAFAAGLGLLRFPDLLARMHTATKPQVLGLLLMMLGLGIRLRTGNIIWMLVLVALFQMLTSPVAAHMVSRAGYRTGKVTPEMLVVDELTEDLEAAKAEILAEAADEAAGEERAERSSAQELGGAPGRQDP